MCVVSIVLTPTSQHVVQLSPIQRVLGFVKADTGNHYKGLGSPRIRFYHIFPKWDRLSFDHHTADVFTSVMNNIEIELMHGERETGRPCDDSKRCCGSIICTGVLAHETKKVLETVGPSAGQDSAMTATTLRSLSVFRKNCSSDPHSERVAHCRFPPIGD
jgi:hypothetical protein